MDTSEVESAIAELYAYYLYAEKTDQGADEWVVLPDTDQQRYLTQARTEIREVPRTVLFRLVASLSTSLTQATATARKYESDLVAYVSLVHKLQEKQELLINNQAGRIDGLSAVNRDNADLRRRILDLEADNTRLNRENQELTDAYLNLYAEMGEDQ